MRLQVGLQPEQAPDLGAPRVDDPGADKVVRVGVHTLQDGEAVAQQLRLGLVRVHRVRRLKDLLRLLPRAAKEEI